MPASITAESIGTGSPQEAGAAFTPEGALAVAGNPALRWYDVLTPGIGSDFEIYAELDSGTVTGTFGSWISLGSTVSWFVNVVSGSGSGQISIDIRRAGEVNIITSGIIIFFAEVTV